MINNDSLGNKSEMSKSEADKYTGMREMQFGLTTNVKLCAAGGFVLGLILALWVTSEIGMVAATVIVFTVLSGIFGMFV